MLNTVLTQIRVRVVLSALADRDRATMKGYRNLVRLARSAPRTRRVMSSLKFRVRMARLKARSASHPAKWKSMKRRLYDLRYKAAGKQHNSNLIQRGAHRAYKAHLAAKYPRRGR